MQIRTRSKKSAARSLLLGGVAAVCFWFFASFAHAAEVKIVKTTSGGWRLLVDNKPFLVKGVVYNPIPPGKDYSYDFWSNLKIADLDGQLMKAAGFNVVRFYSAGENLEETKKFIHFLYEKYGIYTIMGDWLGFWNCPAPYYYDKDFQAKVAKHVLEVVKALKDEPGILMWDLGNENNYSFSGKINFWTSPEIEKLKDPAEKIKRRAEIYYSFVEKIAKEIKKIDKNHPVALGNGELIALDIAKKYIKDIDVLALIFYRGKSFGNIFSSARKIIDKPVLIAEFGCDAYDAFRKKEDQDIQAEFLVSQWEDIYVHTVFSQNNGNCLGGVVFEWNDEWWKHNPDDASRRAYHDTLGGWSNGSYYFDIKAPRNLNMNEEWFGILGFEKKEGQWHKVRRKGYFALREFFKEKGQLNSVSSSKISDFEEGYSKAFQLFSQLKTWQRKKDWQDFFDHKDSYQKQILSLIKTTPNDPVSFRLKSAYLAWQLGRFLKSEDEGARRQEVAKIAEAISPADKDALLELRRILFELSLEKDKYFRRKLLRIYVRLMKKLDDKKTIKEEAERFWRQKDLKDASQLYGAYLEKLKKKKELRQALLDIINKFSFDGVKKNYEGYFAEEAFKRLVDEFGKENLNEDYLYLRGYNLEKISESNKAASVYKEFLERFPNSSLKEEVLFRLGFIYLYKLKNPQIAKEYFLKLKNHPFWSKAAEQQIALLESKAEDLNYNQKAFLKALKGEVPVAPNNLISLASLPARSLEGNKIEIKSVSLSPDTGCLVPKGLYLWSGDLGEVRITTNTPYFITSFNSSGLKVVNVVQTLPEIVGGFDSDLINVYALKITNNDKELSAAKENTIYNKNLKILPQFMPYLPQSFLKFKWYLSGEEEAFSRQMVFAYDLKRKGDYSLRLEVYFLDNKLAEKEFRITIK